MRAFGDQLREAREARGHSLQAVADATRIVVRHLDALERSDLEALPAGPFARGYIEAYAQFLGIDPQPVLKAYRAVGHRRGLDVPETRDRVYEEFSELMAERAKATPGSSARVAKGLAWGLVTAALLGLAWWLVTRTSRPDAAPPAAPSREATAPKEPPPERLREEPGGPSTAEGESMATGAPTSAPEPVTRAAPGAEPASQPEPPVAAQAPPEWQARAATPADLEVTHWGVGTGVESGRLVGRGDRFAEGASVVFWTRVVGGRPGDVVRHIWLHEGQTVGFADLPLGSSHWRTYSRRELPEGATGRWVVEARDPEGEILARQEFLCVPRER